MEEELIRKQPLIERLHTMKKMVQKRWGDGVASHYQYCIDAVNKQTLVQGRSNGNWIWDDHVGQYMCSECGHVPMSDDVYYGLARFCQSCGSKMITDD